MEVVGAAGAILGIIEVATRSLSILADVRKRFTDTSLVLELLISQISTVKIALQQIHELIQNRLREQEQHYSLVISLGSTLKCCDILIRILDDHITKFDRQENRALSLEKKIKLVLSSKSVEDCQSRLDRQILALNLVLNALLW